MKLKSWLFEVIRCIAALAILVSMLLRYGGNPVSNADFETVAQAVTGQVELTNLRQGENRMVKRLYGLDPADYEGCLLYYPATNMDAEELLLIKLKDTAQQEAVRSAMQTRVENQKNAFEGYGVEQYDLLTNYCVLEVKGNFALLAISRSCDDALGALEAAL